MKLRYNAVPPYMKIYLMGWVIYFTSYFGRYNYSASMVAIGQAEGFQKSELGLIATITFVTYGFGQLISGRLGDLFNPKVMICIGTGGLAVCNIFMGFSRDFLQMQIAWGMNGLFSAMIWAPMVRLLTVYMPQKKLKRAILSFSYATAFGQTGTYLLTSYLVSCFSWRMAFFVPAIMSFLAMLGWIVISATIKTFNVAQPVESDVSCVNNLAELPKKNMGFCFVYIFSGLPFILVSILFMGVLKDGIVTWVPQMITDQFHTEAGFSIFLSSVLPLVNSLSVFLVTKVSRNHENDDMRNAILLFSGAAVTMLVLIFTQSIHPVLSIALFSIISTFVTGTNAILISYVPLHFTASGRTSTIAGLTNAFTYLGSALSGWGFGWLSSAHGWETVNWLLLILCLMGCVICVAARPFWTRFVQKKIT